MDKKISVVYTRLIGKTFDDLTVIEATGKTTRRGILWRCECVCGEITEKTIGQLKSNRQQCSHAPIARPAPKRACGWRYPHATYVTEYCALRNAFDRCRRATHPQYADYGGRGITVHPGWDGMAGFQAFMDEVGPKPTALHTLDRIDNDKGYQPGNLRWATRLEQQANRRCSK